MAIPRVGNQRLGVVAGAGQFDPGAFVKQLTHQYHSTFTPGYQAPGVVNMGAPQGMGKPNPGMQGMVDNAVGSSFQGQLNASIGNVPQGGANLGRSNSPADAGYSNEYQPYWQQWKGTDNYWNALNNGANALGDPQMNMWAGAGQQAMGKFARPVAWRPMLHDPGFAGGVGYKPKG